MTIRRLPPVLITSRKMVTETDNPAHRWLAEEVAALHMLTGEAFPAGVYMLALAFDPPKGEPAGKTQHIMRARKDPARLDAVTLRSLIALLHDEATRLEGLLDAAT